MIKLFLTVKIWCKSDSPRWAKQVSQNDEGIVLKCQARTPRTILLHLQRPPFFSENALSAAERGGNILKGLTDFRPENSSSHGQNLALTGLGVPIRSTAEGQGSGWQSDH